MINFNFKNKLVLVLASSKGIGFELAKEFAKNNARVIICSRSAKNLKIAKKNFKKNKIDMNTKFFKIDLSISKNISSFYNKIKKNFKSDVDILINNSGGPPPKLIEETNSNDWDYALNNNLKSFIYMSLKVLPGMKKKKWGRIINLTSTTAKEPAEKMVLSNVSRAGVLAFSKTLSKEIKSNGITVNSILTGGVLTERLIKLIKKKNKIPKTTLNKISKSIPVQHIATPSEFIKIILFLCTDEASYINGTAIPVDGGVTRTIF